MRIFLQQVMWKYIILICLVLCGGKIWAQDSVIQADTDTTIKIISNKPSVPRKLSIKKRDAAIASDTLLSPVKNILPSIAGLTLSSDTLVLSQHPYFRFTDPQRYSVTIKLWEGKEAIFYSIIALLIFFATIKNGFSRYIDDLFKMYFRTSVKQRQIKEHLVQSPLPSLFLNIFFLLSIGIFLALLLRHYQLGLQFNFWMLFLYCALGLVVIYGVKFITLKCFGWIFQIPEAIDAYIFIVFTTNKIIGIAILPFIVMLAFSYGTVNEVAFTLSITLVLGLLAYRFFLSYISIHRLVRISFFHFFLYLCAFEIIPLLLINKLLFRFLGETY